MSLRYLTEDPPNAGVPVGSLDGRLLTQGSMYQRNNFPLPVRMPETVEIVLPGSASRTLTVIDLASHPTEEVHIVLECAGNGRILMNPIPEGTPWDLGGVSPISVTGVRLANVLGDIPAEVHDVVFTGADRGIVDQHGEVSYQFSLDRATASSPLPLLATHIGNEPLTLEHGGPIRLLVPGHYAMKSVKWLTRIEGIGEPFRGHFVEKYRYFGDSDEPEGAPVGAVRVRSVISTPGEGAELEPGECLVTGSAWTGSGRVESVSVSPDFGDTWVECDLGRGSSDTAPVAWSCRLDLGPGPATLMARATDDSGATQPLTARWNRNGYANNVVHRVTVQVDTDDRQTRGSAARAADPSHSDEEPSEIR